MLVADGVAKRWPQWKAQKISY